MLTSASESHILKKDLDSLYDIHAEVVFHQSLEEFIPTYHIESGFKVEKYNIKLIIVTRFEFIYSKDKPKKLSFRSDLISESKLILRKLFNLLKFNLLLNTLL